MTCVVYCEGLTPKILECLCGLRLKEIEDLVMLGDPKADSDWERQLGRRLEGNRKTPQHGVARYGAQTRRP